MAIFFTNWLKKNFSPKSSKPNNCAEEEKCLTMLQLILDGEASDFEEKYFQAHIDDCMCCFERYNLDKCIKQVLKTKLEKRPVPVDLIQSIKLKITHSA